MQPVSEPALPPGVPVLMERFSLSGRLSVRIADRLDSAKIDWVRDGKRETINFFSPFGSQLAQIVSTAGVATLTRGEAVEYAASIGELTHSVVGVAINTDLLARWVQGFDIEASNALVTGGSGARWTVVAENMRAVDGVVGGRIASRISASDGDTTLRLFIDAVKPL